METLIPALESVSKMIVAGLNELLWVPLPSKAARNCVSAGLWLLPDALPDDELLLALVLSLSEEADPPPPKWW